MTANAEPLHLISEHFASKTPRRLGVAVSGGSDSVALLHLLREWGRSRLDIVTVDHGLRPEAADEAAHVATLCRDLDLPHTCLTWRGWDGAGNLQDQARRARYALLANWARERGLDAVALGHTMDDQAETFLMRLSRASGVDGLSAMAATFERDGMRFDRPLLGARRKTLQSYLSALGMRWIDDPTNQDSQYARTRARQALAQLAELGISVGVLAEVSQNMADAAGALAVVAAEYARQHATYSAGDLVFDRTGLRTRPQELQRRLLRGAVRWISSSDYAPRRSVTNNALAAVADTGNITLGGCHLRVSDMTVRVGREHAAVSGLRCASDGVWDGRWRVDGPHESGLEIGALGDALVQCPDWRATGIPRITLLASPAVWRGEQLIAAPLAGLNEGWTASTNGLDGFAASLIAH